jgi:hypothetical protein
MKNSIDHTFTGHDRRETMPAPTPSPTEWRNLYQAAMRLKEVAPWQWMSETDVFGVQNPETGELGFVSVMGELGQHLALALYLGAKGLYNFWAYQQDESAPPEALLSLLHLQAAFQDRDLLSQKDRDVARELGLKFRGRQAWLMFRSYRPGFFPWYLEAWEARFLTIALEQAVEVALRFKQNPALLSTRDDQSYLVRVSRREGDALVWEDQVVAVPPPEPETMPVVMDLEALERVRRLPRSQLTLEMDFFVMDVPMRDKGDRPVFPYMLLLVDRDSDMILTGELLTPERGLLQMWGELPLKLVYEFERIGVVPKRIAAREPLLIQLLGTLVEELGFEVTSKGRLRSLERAKRYLLQRFHSPP